MGDRFKVYTLTLISALVLCGCSEFEGEGPRMESFMDNWDWGEMVATVDWGFNFGCNSIEVKSVQDIQDFIAEVEQEMLTEVGDEALYGVHAQFDGEKLTYFLITDANDARLSAEEKKAFTLDQDKSPFELLIKCDQS
ncbi:hypothetical protein [Persicobacter sp. CCB-QB2]|uniref:hypothetical protein n=1 Tax=Persicobacter sp. CCB-QB2 TaxID=1561025 RepID=UPI0006A9CE2F|nr:hypothetical protein [Persicobacter sp. CCB-QB2]